ncbi:MAG: diaminopimelate decarboxylase [Armatimonadota bacterium]|nr:diaminopimelate decarboxylase [Armatimonadota bacterium]
MMLFGTQRINESGRLEIGGCDTADLAREFGTPLYIMDEELMVENCRRYVRAYKRLYQEGETEIAFAGKAFLTMSMCIIAAREGLSLDVVSAGEINTALKAEYPMERIIFHGNNKSVEEIELALDVNVGRIVIDNLQEIDLLNRIAVGRSKSVDALLRLTPGIDPHTHKLIRTGQADTKFGLNIKDGSAMKGVKAALAAPAINLKGIHCHVGSQLLDTEAHEQAAEVMVAFMKEVLDETGYEVEQLNLGGGLGIRYTESQKPPSIEEFAERVIGVVRREIARLGLRLPRLIQEPGRSIVGEAGATLYTIGAIKEVPITEDPGRRTYVAVDGGMSDNPRPALYDAVYTAFVANKANQRADWLVTIAGKHCESDTLIKDTRIARADAGDLLAVLSTGAYNYSMASNYNRFPSLAAVLVRGGRAEVIVRRGTLDDLLANDVIPERLRSAATSGVGG